MDQKTSVAVDHKSVNGAPCIVLALFLDSPHVQVTKDQHGRPIAVVTFDPDTAYGALTDNIIAHYDAIQRERQAAG